MRSSPLRRLSYAIIGPIEEAGVHVQLTIDAVEVGAMRYHILTLIRQTINSWHCIDRCIPSCIVPGPPAYSMEFFSREGHWSSRTGYRSPLHHLSRDYLIHECEPLRSGHRHCWDPGVVISEAIDQRSSRASRDHLCIHRDHRPRAGGLRMRS